MDQVELTIAVQSHEGRHPGCQHCRAPRRTGRRRQPERMNGRLPDPVAGPAGWMAQGDNPDVVVHRQLPHQVHHGREARLAGEAAEARSHDRQAEAARGRRGGRGHDPVQKPEVSGRRYGKSRCRRRSSIGWL